MQPEINPMHPYACDAVVAVNAGNTFTKIGVVSGGAVLDSWSVTTRVPITTDEVVGMLRMLGVPQVSSILASVVPTCTRAWTEGLREHCGARPFVVGPGLKTGLPMKYKDPGELGADRIANAVAAMRLFGSSVVVIDFGTATNFEVVDDEGRFVGGIIAPGLLLSSRALTSMAAKLSDVELRMPKNAIGKCTREALQSGLVLGEVSRVEGLLRAIWDELGKKTSVVLTGDQARIIADHLSVDAVLDEDLCLKGLESIYRLNAR